MGNRAVITAGKSDSAIGVYVHWNGGRASVQGFLDACRKLGFRSPSGDESYAMAYLTSAICLYFGNGMSCGIGKNGSLDDSDNGTYIIGGNWEIIGRRHFDGDEEIDQAKTDAICKTIVDKFEASKAIEA